MNASAELLTPPGSVDGFELVTVGGVLTLSAAHHPAYGSICAQWDTADLRRRIAAGRRQPLARALGLYKGGAAPLRVVDATAGLGRDAWVIASLGARVTLVERSPAVAALLADALHRAHGDPASRTIAQRISLQISDARRWLANSPTYDAVYLDPMYPQDGKSALPVKEMQFLRELTGGDPDAAELLAAARRCAPRVAVKRPRHAPPLAKVAPDAVVHASRVRFDLYFQPELKSCFA
ncbi:MAG TPA: class I SAM-dependent methyltransferase [Nevskiaceae bacterium]|nr:class I SAM-dependent methyltransferase [Nevskiaceae bacterium]